MDKINILSIGHSYVVASNRAVLNQISKTKEFNITIGSPRTFSGDLRPVEMEREAEENYKLIPIDTFGSIPHVFFYRNLHKTIDFSQYDLVHIWEEPYVVAGYQIAAACLKINTPYMFRSAQSLNKTYPPPFRYFEKFCVNNARGWVAGASLVKKNLLGRGYPQDRSRVINLGVDEKLFSPAPEIKQEMLAQLKLKSPVIGFVGRLSKAKGLDILMSALERISHPWSLLILGSGSYESKLRKWISKNNLEDRVRIVLARHSEVPKYLQAMDLLVAPSQTMPNWKEQFGRMIVEAFACKIPVIGSDSGEIPFVISDAGLVVEEKNTDEWVDAISRLLQSKDERRYFAEKGYCRFLEKYSANRVANSYMDFYRQLIGK